MNKTKFCTVRRLTDESTYLSSIYEAEDKEGKKYRIKRNVEKLTTEHKRFMLWLLQNPHPNLLVPLGIYGKVGEILEEVYEFVSWPLLADILVSPRYAEVKTRFDFTSILRVMRQMTSALGHLHAGGFIHHDVRERNLFLNTTSIGVKLFDYNRVREPYFLESGKDSWNDDPPEYRGGTTQIDFRYDVYQAGRLFFKMTHNYAPDHDREILRIQMPDEALEVIAKASSSNREQRYEDCNEMHEAIINLERLVS